MDAKSYLNGANISGFTVLFESTWTTMQFEVNCISCMPSLMMNTNLFLTLQ